MGAAQPRLGGFAWGGKRSRAGGAGLDPTTTASLSGREQPSCVRARLQQVAGEVGLRQRQGRAARPNLQGLRLHRRAGSDGGSPRTGQRGAAGLLQQRPCIAPRPAISGTDEPSIN